MEEPPEIDAEEFTISTNDREAVRWALDRWLDECQLEAREAFESGRAGYIGRIKLCAFVGDSGISFRVERSISADV